MAPVIEVSGRTYPVDIKYCPMTAQDEEQDVVSAVVATVEEISRIDHGDILVFFAAEREIREAAEALNKRSLRLTEAGTSEDETISGTLEAEVYAPFF